MALTISNNGINLIKQFEGCRLSAYKDAVGVITIGYGWTKDIDGKPLTMGTTITQAKAELLLKEGLKSYETNVNKYDPKYHWNQNQFDALVSFAYNIGSIDQLVANGTRTISEIADKITAYNKAGGKVLAGLTNRRNAERELFLKDSSIVSTSTSAIQTTSLITTGLQHAKNFTGIDDSANISKAKARVLQRGLNLDYGKSITEDGIIGTASKSKLGTHYVAKGEKQYMVTAAEILMYLNNIDPNGVELPGIYGNGLITAAKNKFGGTGQRIDASNFLALV